MAKNSNSGPPIPQDLANMMNLPGLRTADDKYLYKAVVIVTSRPDPGQIGRAPNVLDVAFAWAASVREAVTKIELAYGKGGGGKPQLIEIMNCAPTDIVWSQLMDKDLDLVGDGAGPVVVPFGSREN